MAERVLFGRFEIRPAQRELLVSGKRVDVGARAFDLLLALIEHRGRVVPKDRLLEVVWPGLVVEENNLQVHISRLRKVLGARSIATVPGVGYSFTGELVDAAPDASAPAESQGHNLPLHVSSFIGRERELRETETLLEKTRLTTLVGAGGIGKTRLALQLAARSLKSFPDGAWLVELAPLADGRRVAEEVARVLEVTEHPRETLAQALVGYLRERRLLLVLDNCEHLAEACTELIGTLLQACPHLKILATSRERLRVTGEARYPVPALSLPGDERTGSHADAADSEAARLFTERAAAVDPAFKLTERNAGAVVDICRRLDGVPLALELAAARVRALPVETLSQRLADCFRLLTGGDTTALPRHQTLRACIDWSHAQLSDDERMLFRRLAVFAGSWSLEAAEDVAVGGAIARTDVLDLLTALVDKSLVETTAGGTRYRMLETVRQYAGEQLALAGEQETVRSRHLAFCLAWSAEIEPKLYGPEQQIWLSRLDAEHDNLLAAMQACERIDNGGCSAVTLIHLLDRWIIVRGLLETAYRTAVTALARIEMQRRDGLRCRGLWLASELEYYLGRYASAQAAVEESLAIAREIGEPRREAEALRLLGYLLHAGGDAAQARRRFDEALAIVRPIEDAPGLAATLNGLAELHRAERAFAAAIPCYEEALALYRARGDRRGIAVQLGNFAKVEVSLGRRDHARTMLEEALDISDQLGSLQARLNALEGCAGFACLLGRWETAARWMSAAEALWKASGFFREPVDADYVASVAAQTREGLPPAEHRAAEQAGRGLRYDEVAAEARALLRGPDGAGDAASVARERPSGSGAFERPVAAAASQDVSGRVRRPRMR